MTECERCLKNDPDHRTHNHHVSIYVGMITFDFYVCADCQMELVNLLIPFSRQDHPLGTEVWDLHQALKGGLPSPTAILSRLAALRNARQENHEAQQTVILEWFSERRAEELKKRSELPNILAIHEPGKPPRDVEGIEEQVAELETAKPRRRSRKHKKSDWN
jgi:hypothetical protein